MRKGRALAFSFVCIAIASLIGCDSGSDGGTTRQTGGSTLVNGSSVQTWADTDFMGNIVRVGMTMDADLVDNPPMEPGEGPLGATAVLPYPTNVQQRTMFNHFELHWNVGGHEPPVYEHPHFDFHFYDMTEAQVRAIVPPDTMPPAANRIPAGYVYPGVNAAVPQMGVHAAPEHDFMPGHMFEHTMILGYWDGRMTFVEPMITQEFLQKKQSFSMSMPEPAVLGQDTLWPRRFDAIYNAQSDTWSFEFSDFVSKS